MSDRGYIVSISATLACDCDRYAIATTAEANKPQPVPPIYQPEVAARAIVWAVDHDRDELWVGWPTVKAIIGNRIVPRWLDRRLAQSGYESQQTDEPEETTREHNLWSPIQGDYGAHGRFDEQARTWSSQLWLTTHRQVVVLIGLTIIWFIGAIVAKWRTQNE